MDEMKAYIGVKLIEAKPMTLGGFGRLVGKATPLEDDHKEGYLVVYQPDGYKSWSPKETFESAYFPLERADSISSEDVDLFSNDMDSSKLDEKTVHVCCTAPTGFVWHETSSCVDPENFDMQIGTACASDKIKDKVWSHLGFVLQWAKFGLKK